MEVENPLNAGGRRIERNELPGILKRYRNSDFGIQQKVIFIHRLCIAMVTSLILMMLYTSYVQIINPIYGKIFLPVLIPEFLIMIITLISLAILIKGYYLLSTQMLLITTLATVWIVMFLDKGVAVSRLDTIVFIYAILSALPLLIDKSKTLYIVYISVNIIILFAFIFINGKQLDLNKSTVIDYISDIIISLTFLGIVAYNISKINRRSFERAIQDIKERHKAEKALIESEKKYTETIDLLPQTIFESDLTGKLTYLNKIGFDVFGYTTDDLINGVSIFSMITQNEKENASENIKKILAGVQKRGNQYTAYRKDATTFPVQIYSKVIETNGKPSGFRGIIIDNTEQVKTEKTLKENEERYRSLIESLNEAIIVADNNHKVEFVNKQFTEILGYTPDEIVGKIGYKILQDPEDLKVVESANSQRIKNVLSSYELPFKAKDGRKFDFLVSGSPLKNAEGEVIGSIGALTDITERKKAEKALKESQQLFQTLTQSSPVGIFRTRADGYTTFVNPKWSELSGLSFEEAIGDGWLRAVHPDDRLKIKNNWEKDANNGSTSITEYRFLKSDGSIVWVLGDAIPEIIDGKIKGFIGTITDITEIKNAQGLLESSEKRFRELSDLLPQPVWEADSSGRLTYINNHGMELYGYNIKEFEQEINLLSTVAPEQRERAALNIHDRLCGIKVSNKDEEYISIKKNGERFPIQIYVATIKENENIVGLRGITIDITEIKKAGEALRQSEEKYRTLMENMNEVVIMVDNQDRIQYVNKKFSNKLGYSPEEILGKSSYNLLYDPNDINEINKATQKRKENNDYQFEVSFATKNHDKIIFLVSFAQIISPENKRTGSIIVLTDITEKKKIEDELEKYRNHLELLVNERTEELAAANEELKSTNKELYDQRKVLEEALNNLKETQNKLIQSEKMASLGVLAAGIAHEINNPLNFINGGASGIASYINENLKDHLDEIKPFIEGIQTGVKRAADIVTSLNHYSRRDDLPSSKCDINEIIDNCLVMLHNQLKNGIEVIKKYDNKSYNLWCNEGKLHQVFLNLLSNSIQAIDDKGTITIFTGVKKDYLTITISDTGCGISRENILKIADPFFTTKEPGKGTGLGLSITYKIIKEYDGALEFESEVGVGTKAIIILPLSKEN